MCNGTMGLSNESHMCNGLMGLGNESHTWNGLMGLGNESHMWYGLMGLGNESYMWQCSLIISCVNKATRFSKCVKLPKYLKQQLSPI